MGLSVEVTMREARAMLTQVSDQRVFTLDFSFPVCSLEGKMRHRTPLSNVRYKILDSKSLLIYKMAENCCAEQGEAVHVTCLSHRVVPPALSNERRRGDPDVNHRDYTKCSLAAA